MWDGEKAGLWGNKDSEQVSREAHKVGLRDGRRGAAQLSIKVTIKDGATVSQHKGHPQVKTVDPRLHLPHVPS